MADCYVNFYAALDPGGHTRGAQAFQGRASQAHRGNAAVGVSAAAPTAIPLEGLGPAATQYVEIRVTSGNVFACILPTEGVTEGLRTAARVRIDNGDRLVMARGLDKPAALYIWAA